MDISFRRINEWPNVYDVHTAEISLPNGHNGVIVILCIAVKLNRLKSNENVIPAAPRENNCPGIAALRRASGRIYSDARYF